jgi:hypothetical protein
MTTGLAAATTSAETTSVPCATCNTRHHAFLLPLKGAAMALKGLDPVSDNHDVAYLHATRKMMNITRARARELAECRAGRRCSMWL